jgi:hypothetical protein
MILQRTLHKPQSPLDCSSLAGVNRAFLFNLAPVWSVIVGQKGEVQGKSWGDIWVIRWGTNGRQSFTRPHTCAVLEGNRREASKGQSKRRLMWSQPLKSYPEIVLVHVCCHCIIINSILFNFLR